MKYPWDGWIITFFAGAEHNIKFSMLKNKKPKKKSILFFRLYLLDKKHKEDEDERKKIQLKKENSYFLMIWISPYIALHRKFLGTRENTLALFGHKFKLIPPGNSFRINVVFVWNGMVDVALKVDRKAFRIQTYNSVFHESEWYSECYSCVLECFPAPK